MIPQGKQCFHDVMVSWGPIQYPIFGDTEKVGSNLEKLRFNGHDIWFTETVFIPGYPGQEQMPEAPVFRQVSCEEAGLWLKANRFEVPKFLLNPEGCDLGLEQELIREEQESPSDTAELNLGNLDVENQAAATPTAKKPISDQKSNKGGRPRKWDSLWKIAEENKDKSDAEIVAKYHQHYSKQPRATTKILQDVRYERINRKKR